MKNITALLLCGGDSSRLWPIGDKHLIKFLGRPLIQHVIHQLQRFGVDKVLIVVKKSNKSSFERIRRNFRDISIVLVEQVDPRGMAGAVISARKYMLDKPVLIIGPSDVYEDALLCDFARIHKNNYSNILAGTFFKGYFPGGYLKIDREKIVGIVEKPSPSKLPSNIVRLVFDYFDKINPLIETINRINSKHDDVYEKAIQLMIDEGFLFTPLIYKGFWGYLKYPWHVLTITSYFLDKIHGKQIKMANISRKAEISGDVFIEDEAVILENAKIFGPSYIGKGTVIGQNCLVRQSMIGANCVVGFTSEIVRSYVGDNCWFHTNYIGDSVICDDVGLGAGTVLSNLRLDESVIKSQVAGKKIKTGKTKLGSIIGSNVRIGVNTSIMPGVKIGKNSFIGAGVVLDGDISDSKFCCFDKRKYRVTDNKKEVRDEFRKKLKSNLKLSY